MPEYLEGRYLVKFITKIRIIYIWERIALVYESLIEIFRYFLLNVLN
jgi:hypothetical protein